MLADAMAVDADVGTTTKTPKRAGVCRGATGTAPTGISTGSPDIGTVIVDPLYTPVKIGDDEK
jgi:hypothetical protein